MRLRILAAAALLFVACGDDQTAPSGEERGPCYPNNTCNEGLVCASEICVDVSTGGESGSGPTGADEENESEDDGASEEGGVPPDTASDDACTQQFLNCQGSDSVECLFGYIQCFEEEGVGGCDSFHNGCDLVGWEYAGCETGSSVEDQYCGAETSSGGDTDGSGTSGGSADSGGDQCPTPGCSDYADKLDSCYPKLGIDWYAECLNVYDICDSGGCLSGTAGQVACVNSRPCEEITDGACNAGQQC